MKEKMKRLMIEKYSDETKKIKVDVTHIYSDERRYEVDIKTFSDQPKAHTKLMIKKIYCVEIKQTLSMIDQRPVIKAIFLTQNLFYSSQICPSICFFSVDCYSDHITLTKL